MPRIALAGHQVLLDDVGERIHQAKSGMVAVYLLKACVAEVLGARQRQRHL